MKKFLLLIALVVGVSACAFGQGPRGGMRQGMDPALMMGPHQAMGVGGRWYEPAANTRQCSAQILWPKVR